MKDNNTHSFINLVVNENLTQAKEIINDQLNKKLASTLEAKFEEFAPSIFEKWDIEKADKNKDGKISDWEKASTEWASKGEDGNVETPENEEQSEEEEESGTEDETDEEADDESEEDEEDSESEEKND